MLLRNLAKRKRKAWNGAKKYDGLSGRILSSWNMSWRPRTGLSFYPGRDIILRKKCGGVDILYEHGYKAVAYRGCSVTQV